MSKIAIMLFFISTLLCSCNNKSRAKAEVNSLKNTTSLAKTQESEDFNIFFTRFQKDSVFQKDRIIFPLKNLLYNTEKASFDEKMINEKEWRFMNFSNLPENYLGNITKSNNDEFNYNIQIEDTGVSVNYIFKIHNNKWYLVEIKDEST